MDGTTAYVLAKKLIERGGISDAKAQQVIADYVANHPEVLLRIDKTLSLDGHAADSKAVGDLLDDILKVEEGTEIEIPTMEDLTATNQDLSKLREEVNEADSRLSESILDILTRLKSGKEEDSELHLGFYLDENGDLCQKEVE